MKPLKKEIDNKEEEKKHQEDSDKEMEDVPKKETENDELRIKPDDKGQIDSTSAIQETEASKTDIDKPLEVGEIKLEEGKGEEIKDGEENKDEEDGEEECEEEPEDEMHEEEQ